MDERFKRVMNLASTQHGTISTRRLEDFGVGASLRHQWVGRCLLRPYGPRAFFIGGSPPSWEQTLTAGWLNLSGHGRVAGRSAARMLGLDSFFGDSKEFLLPRRFRRLSTPGIVRSSSRPFRPGDVVARDGMQVLSAERLIVDAGLFGFSEEEIADAIDSAIRLRLVSEKRLRDRVGEQPLKGRRRNPALVGAMVDAGGESALERRFFALVRERVGVGSTA